MINFIVFCKYTPILSFQTLNNDTNCCSPEGKIPSHACLLYNYELLNSRGFAHHNAQHIFSLVPALFYSESNQ